MRQNIAARVQIDAVECLRAGILQFDLARDSCTATLGTYIPTDLDEDLCVRFFRGESMDAASAEKTEGTSTCSRIIGSASGKKAKQKCHHIFESQGQQGSCRSNGEAYMSSSEHDLRTVGRRHDPYRHRCAQARVPAHSPPTKVPADVKHLYDQAIRAFGVSAAAVNKVERAATTIQIMEKAPGFVHPSLLQVSTKQGIITALERREAGGDKSGWEGRSPASVVITTFETTLLECVELVRGIDQDTTFKRLKADLLNEYELTTFFTLLDRRN
ncbi:hypothetical protein C8R45DRAFT_929375 [Mycena sanguinolenta]|nr:hypothetical protein C8R45DRAFT_929375 [Mycena sanguinolenta]